MKTMASLLLLVLLSSFIDDDTCDPELLYGKWTFIHSYEEGEMTVDSLLKANIDSLLKDEIISPTRAYMIYQKNEIAINALSTYITHETYQVTKDPCRIQHLSVISYKYRFTTILYIDDTNLITAEKDRICFYKKEKDY